VLGLRIKKHDTGTRTFTCQIIYSKIKSQVTLDHQTVYLSCKQLDCNFTMLCSYNSVRSSNVWVPVLPEKNSDLHYIYRGRPTG